LRSDFLENLTATSGDIFRMAGAQTTTPRMRKEKEEERGIFFPVEITQTTYFQRNVLMPGKDRLGT